MIDDISAELDGRKALELPEYLANVAFNAPVFVQCPTCSHEQPVKHDVCSKCGTWLG